MFLRNFWRPHLSIASRIAILILPPLAAMIALTVIVLNEERLHTQDLERVARVSTLTNEIGGLVHELQKERGASNVVLSSHGRQFRQELKSQRGFTDIKLKPFQNSDRMYSPDPNSRLQVKLREIRTRLTNLDEIRIGIDAISILPATAFNYYTTTISSLMDVVLEGGAATGDIASQRTFLALFNLMQAKERAGQERAMGSEGFAAGRFEESVYDRFKHLKDEENSFLDIFRSYATDEQRRTFDTRLTDLANQEVAQLRAIALAGGIEGKLQGVTGSIWFNAATRRINILRDVEMTLSNDVEARAQAEAASARSWLHVMTALLIVAVGAIGWLCWLTGRGLKLPIHRMTEVMVALAAGNTESTVPYTGRRDEIGAMAAAVTVFRVNASIRREREQEIAHMAGHDALTGVFNRFAFQERIHETVKAAGDGRSAAIFCLDLDDFKSVNDTLGHSAGDELLRTISDRIQTCLGPHDMLARLGGDEFAIIRSDIRSAEDARTLAAEILNALSPPFVLEGKQCQPKASVGITLTPTDGLLPDQLVKRADLALYQAKQDGGGRAYLFSLEMETRLEERRVIEADLWKSLGDGDFALHYQPLVNASTDRVEGFEALVRWQHPARGMVPPAEFIPVAEETRIIVPLGRWIIERACADASQWPAELSVAINVSSLQFKDPLLFATISEALARNGMSPSRLEIEITESVLLADDAATLGILHDLRALGVRISLDDFGTGYSSLSYLRSFPFDKIKIDQSFTRDIGVTKSAKAIIQAVATLGHSLGMAITVEGVETAEQCAVVRAHGCSQLQGYFYSRPRPVDEISSMLKIIHSPKGSIRDAA